MPQSFGGPRRTVGLFSTDVPRELLHALGCTPVCVFPTAGKPTAAEDFLPRNFCALTRLILASFLEDGGPSLDAVIFADEDDATRRLHDVWRAWVPVPVWGFVEVPRAATPLAASHYADTLTRLVADLEARTGQSLTPSALRQAIALYNEQRSLLADLKRRWLVEIVDTATYRRLRRMALTWDPVTANEQLRQALKKHDKETRRHGDGVRGRQGEGGDTETGRQGDTEPLYPSVPLLVSDCPFVSLSFPPAPAGRTGRARRLGASGRSPRGAGRG